MYRRVFVALLLGLIVELLLWVLNVSVSKNEQALAQVGIGVPPSPIILPPPVLPGAPAQQLPPGAPSTLAPLVPLTTATLMATPTLISPQAVATPSPSPTPRVFACTCYGFGARPFWSGNVTANGYYAARAAAENACLTFQFSRSPAIVNIPTPAFAFFPTPLPPVGTIEGVPGLPNLNVAPGGVSGFALLQSRRGQIFFPRCAQCACN